MLRARLGIDLGRLWVAIITDCMRPNMGSQIICIERIAGKNGITSAPPPPTTIYFLNLVSLGELYSKFLFFVAFR